MIQLQRENSRHRIAHLFNALGLTKEEMERPLVGIVSSYNEIVPGHMNLDKIVERCKAGRSNGRRNTNCISGDCCL